MTVSVRSPKKSILSMPSLSSASSLYCVVMTSLDPLASGTHCVRSPLAITMPAACTPVWRLRPSGALGDLHELFNLGIVFAFLLELRHVLAGHLDRRPQFVGDQLGDAVHLRNRKSHHAPDVAARPSRASIEPKVMIWATLFSPYLLRTY